MLHPPLDNGLRKGLIKHFSGRPDMSEKVDFGAIKKITEYTRYRTVIEGCCVAARELRSVIDINLPTSARRSPSFAAWHAWDTAR